MELSPETEQLLTIYASVQRLSSRCFRVCDRGSGVALDPTTSQCVHSCIDSWIQVRAYVNGRFDAEREAVLRYNKGLLYATERV
jgi:hypothetical protein